MQIFSQGLLPTLRSLAALTAIANAVDADGRWCFFLLENLAQRSSGTLSVSSLKRAIDDLAEAGIVRKLTRSETIDFFAEDIRKGRSPYRLPCVLELLVPAEDYSELVLEEINACRARLGEEPLTAHNRPRLKRRRTPAQIEPAPSSDRPTDCFPGDGSDAEVDSSVRGTSSTGEQNRQKPRSGPFGIIDRIPNTLLADPVADRERLALAVDKLLRQGLGEADVRALFSGMERLRRPFPALMWRLRHVKAACDYLNGSLGRGIHGSGLPVPPRLEPEEDDPFARPEQFPLDSQGKATGTCPEHLTVRNVPGGTCAICGRLCRSVPGELVHEPVPGAAALPEGVSVLRAVDRLSPEEKAALDSELLERMGESLSGAGRAHSFEPVPRNVRRASSGAGPTTRARTWADRAREQLEKARMCGTRWDPIG
ncbi:hypothetical protein [Nocardiopsis ganjiahuensis]|uniref:hypothetical protein n=1 Tax=Nocardiopsis ganjiahuensis TaxID=239984 RepID=UPI00034CDEC5|nr:hypothetical protein [Nocardiopsis ganjiahuensis]